MSDGNGNGKSGWTPGVISSGVVLSLLGTVGGVVHTTYMRDKDRLETRIITLEGQRDEHAFERGIVRQRLDQIQAMAETNRVRIEAAFKELDEKLQREMRLLNDTDRAGLESLDTRLQAEISRSSREDSDLVEANRMRLEALESFSKSVWTRDEQRNFEQQMGLKYERGVGITK